MTAKQEPFDSDSQNGNDHLSVSDDSPQGQAGSIAAVPQPVKPSERIQSIDVLRGFAVLGILTMNIVFFAWPMPGYENPNFSGGDDVINSSAWVVNSLFFSGKFMTLFSMLFGAGLVLISDRAAARGTSNLGVYYRRIFWLFCIGMIHAYLIWAGDILVMYALCGVLLYLFRKRSPRVLIIVGVTLILIQIALVYGFSQYGSFVSNVAGQVDADLAAGREPKEWQLAVHEGWNKGMRAFMEPNQDDVDKAIADHRGSYLEIVKTRAPFVAMMQIFGFLLFGLWGAGGRMLLGMALMKLGIFSAQRTWRFYQRTAMIGYGVGIPLTVYGIVDIWANDYSPIDSSIGILFLGLGMVPVALGHAALVLLACKAKLNVSLIDRLAAVGRMALTNYLTHSVICTTLFYGYGGDLFGRVDRLGLWGFVLGIWVLQLVICPIWLKHFRFGPAEWIWRCLTYWRWQSFRNRVDA